MEPAAVIVPEGWRELSPYCIRSEDRTFTICLVSGSFELWRLGEQLFVNLETFGDAFAAFENVPRGTKAA
jgi:hypothetical protein